MSKGQYSRDVAGSNNPRFRHGMCHTKIYDIWNQIIGRCLNPSHARYADYGGRGVTVCDEWRDFTNFYADMGDRPEGKSIDRLDNSMGYSKANCAWVPISSQNTNKRNNRLITAFGLTLPITWMGRLIGVGSSHLGKLLKKHHIEDVIIMRVGSVGADQLWVQ